MVNIGYQSKTTIRQYKNDPNQYLLKSGHSTTSKGGRTKKTEKKHCQKQTNLRNKVNKIGSIISFGTNYTLRIDVFWTQ